MLGLSRHSHIEMLEGEVLVALDINVELLTKVVMPRITEPQVQLILHHKSGQGWI